LETFLHRGDFKASRKSEAFKPITPLTPADITQSSIEASSLEELVANIQKLRKEVRTRNAELTRHPDDPIAQPVSPP